MYKIQSNKGFSLVELSIVLIIIGLLIAGVTAGSKLIEQAKIAGYIQTIQEFDRANSTFKLTYNAIPGDFDKGIEFGFCQNIDFMADRYCGTVGDDDGSLSSNEARGSFFWHLDGANLYKATVGANELEVLGANKISDKNIGIGVINNGLYYAFSINGNSFSEGASNQNYSQIFQLNSNLNTVVGNGSSFYHINTVFIYGIDKKMDDGLSNTGRITAVNGYRLAGQNCFTTAGDNSTNYNISSDVNCLAYYESPSLN